MTSVPDATADIEKIKQRKRDGISLPLEKNVQAKYTSTYLEYVRLIHNALPEIDYDEIDLSTMFLEHRFSCPFIIDSMTGGTPEATIINARLGQLAEKYGFGMGLGSQRAGLTNQELEMTYSIARQNAPTAFLIANIGGAQLAKNLSLDSVFKIIDMIDANALVIHLNPLQELIQPEGEPKYKGVLKKIAELIKSVSKPVIVKEVGSGISRDVALMLKDIGVSAINVAGSGGTSWAGVEKLRAELAYNDVKKHLGELFWDWGIPTALSIIYVRDVVNLPIISSGGLRNGLDVAKSIVLGSDMGAMAFPFLVRAAESFENLSKFAEMVIIELKSSMFLVGAVDIPSLKKSKYILTGALAQEVVFNESR